MTYDCSLLCIYFFLLICGYVNTDSMGNPFDVEDIIDLDHEYLTYDRSHSNHDSDAVQYYLRSHKGESYRPLYHNNAIDLNTPLCFMEAGKVVCERGSEQSTKFYHDPDHTVAVAIANENGTMKLKGVVNTNDATYEYEPVQSKDLPPNRYHVIKKRWTANIIQTRTQPFRSSRNSQARRSPFKKIPTPGVDELCVDILCVIDYSIYKKFKKTEKTIADTLKKIRYYYAHVINGINMRYATITEDLSIKVRLAGYFVAKGPKDLPFMDRESMDSDPSYKVDSNYTLTYLDSFLKSATGSWKPGELPDYNHAMLFLEYIYKYIIRGALFNITLSNDVEYLCRALRCGDAHARIYIKTVICRQSVNSQERGSKACFNVKFSERTETITKDWTVFTRYARTNLGGSVLGTSFVSGICSGSKGTSLVVDHGAYTSAGIGTHELGHNLGVFFHDGEGPVRSQQCNASFNYIMAPASYLIDEKNLRYSFTFSKCSIEQIKKHVDSLVKMNKNCLKCSDRQRTKYQDKIIDREVRGHMETLPGEIENVHAQCKQLYGGDSFMCPPTTPEEMCYRMYCYDPKRSACAIISEQMAAPGTPCGSYKICSMGKCVLNKERGRDVSDDCPYPDIPSFGAHCEDASPFMCKNEKFRQKCCTSCNKKFTAEEACKDSHIRINGMTCAQLMLSLWGRPGCASDYNVQNMCCLSCKKLMSTNAGSSGLLIHLGGNQLGNDLRRSGNSVRVRTLGSRSRGNSQSRGSRPKVVQKSTGQTGKCEDSTHIKFNHLSCPNLIKSNSRFCKDCRVQRVCCRSCKSFKSIYKC